jgi:hypothetical protein
MSNHERLLAYLKKHKSATPMQIRNDLGISNVADAIMKIRFIRVWHVRHNGLDVVATPYRNKLKTIMITVTNRYGKKCRVASYSLLK